jgi:predicted ester cyclase
MSAEENKQAVRQIFEEGMNNGNLDIFDKYIHERYVNHDLPAPAPGAEGLKQVTGMFKSGFPDMHIELSDVIGEGDRVVSRGSWTGTHKGEFMGIPPTGKHVSVSYMDIWRFENGKGIENWVKMDMLGLMQQLGVVPS